MKKLLTILVLIMLIISFFQITSMYALYKEQIYGEYNTLLGAWEIKINTQDVTTSGQVKTFTIANDQLGYVSSEYIQAGKIAPSGKAYFDVVIDPTNTDVSIVYKVDIGTLGTAILNPGTAEEQTIQLTEAIEFYEAEVFFAQVDEEGELSNQTTTETIEVTNNTYTSVIPISKIRDDYKQYIRLYFKWKNVEANTNNDTTLGATDTAFSIPLQINLKQYTGEVISNGS